MDGASVKSGLMETAGNFVRTRRHRQTNVVVQCLNDGWQAYRYERPENLSWNELTGQKSFYVRLVDYLDLVAECQPPTEMSDFHLRQKATIQSQSYVNSITPHPYPLLLTGRSGLDPVATLDHIGFEAYRTRCTVELEK